MFTNKDRLSKWGVPLFALLGGGAMFAAASVGGNPGLGRAMFLIMVVYAALLLAGGRSEFVRSLRGQPVDERYQSLDLRATAYAGSATILVLIGGFLYELAQGQDGRPYSLLCALAGLSYFVSLLWLRWRS